jgi:hypothetical protein
MVTYFTIAKYLLGLCRVAQWVRVLKTASESRYRPQPSCYFAVWRTARCGGSRSKALKVLNF